MKYIPMTVISAFVFMFIFSSAAVQAHSVVVSSNPEEGSTVTDEITSITMTFNTTIEQEQDVYLENENGERIESQEISIEGDTVTASFAEPLESSDYTVFFEVFGADGHLVEGQFAFSVDTGNEGQEETAEDSGTDANSETGGSDDSAASGNDTKSDSGESSQEEADAGTASAEATGDDGSGGISGGVIAMIIALAVIAIAIVIFLARKRA
ncbi:copper resistance CopC family protein [Virgibacillus ihumii]|uniref:copper resistance CopC family protein n=1 Tax=Virgibacillus ihumii TaxID=2686091 RepID=UPI001FE5EE57|nr:copper resistance protein CopC [Virgibacillus ihumii]